MASRSVALICGMKPLFCSSRRMRALSSDRRKGGIASTSSGGAVSSQSHHDAPNNHSKASVADANNHIGAARKIVAVRTAAVIATVSVQEKSAKAPKR